MDFHWTEQDRELFTASRSFAEKELVCEQKTPGFAWDMWRACAKQGVLGLSLPKKVGGQGVSFLGTTGAFEALGRGGADRGLLFAVGAHLFGCAMSIAKYGSGPQREQYLPDLSNGDVVAALAVTEPACGSSISDMATQAEKTSAGYRLDGTKMFVTNGADASLFLVIASEVAERKAMGLTAFLVPAGTKGLSTEPLPSAGMPLAPMTRVCFERCHVPQEFILGRNCGGFAILLAAMQTERTAILAGFLGAAERDLSFCVQRMKQRSDHQGQLYGHQAVAHRLARMKTRIESARWMLYRGAWEVDNGRDSTAWPAMTKYTVSETIVECALEVLRTLAGAGWLDEFGCASALRDVVGTLSASGTSDTQLNTIASGLVKNL